MAVVAVGIWIATSAVSPIMAFGEPRQEETQIDKSVKPDDFIGSLPVVMPW